MSFYKKVPGTFTTTNKKTKTSAPFFPQTDGSLSVVLKRQLPPENKQVEVPP